MTHKGKHFQKMKKKDSTPLTIKIALTLFLMGYNVTLNAQVDKQKMNNQNQIGLDFYCQGNYIEIEGVKYYDNESAFVCSSVYQTLFLLSLNAFHPDGSPFPLSTIWEANGVQIQNGILSSTPFEPLQLNSPEVKAYYLNGQDEVSVTIRITFSRIEFSESASQLYGFDPNKQGEQHYPSYISGEAWKSIQLNETDVFNVDMTPTGVFPFVTIHSSNGVNFPVTPGNPSGNSNVLTAGADILGSAYAYSKIEDQNVACTIEGQISQVNLASYEPKTKMIKFYVVEEDNHTNFALAANTDVNAVYNDLNQIFKGGVFEWEANPLELNHIVVDYDEDEDEKLDITEMQAIVQSGCCPQTPDLYYVFLVDNIQLIPGNDPYGFALGTSRYTWVAANQASDKDVYDTIAHELGHSLGLEHPFVQFPGHPEGFDPPNIMDYTIQNYVFPRIFRKYQWDEIH